MRKFNLVGIDGNAFSVMGYVCNCMEAVYNRFMTESRNYESESEKFANIANNYNKAARDAYTKRAMSSDYNNLLCESVEMVDKCDQEMSVWADYGDDEDED